MATLRRIEDLYGYDILARDGEVGRVHDFYFDNLTWAVRYLVVETGPWLVGRRVLVSPLALERPCGTEEELPVRLTKEQIENSPDVNLAQPVSRQQLRDLHTYYAWPWYGSPMTQSGAAYTPAIVPPAFVEEDLRAREEEQKEDDPYLRSSREVTGYHIQARDGEIGHVDDFLVDPVDWFIRYLIVDTRNWLPGRQVLVSPTWVEEVRWLEQKVHVDLKRETIRKSPEYEPGRPVEREYEEALHRHYGRRGYWNE